VLPELDVIQPLAEVEGFTQTSLQHIFVRMMYLTPICSGVPPMINHPLGRDLPWPGGGGPAPMDRRGEFYGSLLEAGRISRFEPFLVAGRGAPLRGFTKRRSTYVPASGSSRPSQAVRAICESSFFDSGQRRQACMIRATRSRGSPPGRRR